MSNAHVKINATPHIIDNLDELRQVIRDKKQANLTIGFVPTMGYLHEGHLSLVRQAKQEADISVASIFVNPTQFAPGEDFESYPRDTEADIAKMASVGVDFVWLPPAEIMYPENASTNIRMSNINEPLEGEFRPHFFHGVATVVLKLLLQVQPDIAIFGEKDYQQFLVVKRLVKDMSIPVKILGGALVRDENGLALSSRNAYLNDTDYEIALSLNRTLFAMKEKLHQGEDIKNVEAWGMKALTEAGFSEVQYCAVRDAETLLPVTGHTKTKRIFAAALVGSTRLIDNIEV